MGKIPNELRESIAANIRAERMKKYPGRGGGKRCAEAFGVSPQQWSPWERGTRTPDECRLRQIADHFGVSVEYLRSARAATAPVAGSPDLVPYAVDSSVPLPQLLAHLHQHKLKVVYKVELTVAAMEVVPAAGP